MIKPNETILLSDSHGDKFMLKDIINTNCHESEIQKYLQENPKILKNAIGNFSNRIYPKFKLGSEYECDFIMYSMLSTHSETMIVELKLPSARLLTKSNIPTKDLNLALSQVGKYANWIYSNPIYFKKQIFSKSMVRSVFGQICDSISGYRNCIKSVIIIGQRNQFSDEENLYRQNLYQTTQGRIEIVSYDRLIECE